jgi:hypothetical protein
VDHLIQLGFGDSRLLRRRGNCFGSQQIRRQIRRAVHGIKRRAARSCISSRRQQRKGPSPCGFTSSSRRRGKICMLSRPTSRATSSRSGMGPGPSPAPSDRIRLLPTIFLATRSKGPSMPRDFSSGAWARQPNHAREADRGRCLRRSVSVSATRKATHACSSLSISPRRMALACDARHRASSSGRAWRTWISDTPSHNGRPPLASAMRSSRKTRSWTSRSASAPLSARKALPLMSAT